MNRDTDLVRAILLEVEWRSWDQRNEPVKIEGYTDEHVGHHVRLLDQAGLIEALNVSGEYLAWYPTCLTWDSHDFLDAASSSGPRR